MNILKRRVCNKTSSRAKCFIIGYMNLVACIADIACHLLILAIVTNQFQCDASYERLRSFNWVWLEPILLVLNIGTHGFYPFPLIIHYRHSARIDYLPTLEEPKCYPGMLHVNLVDILDLTINIIYLKFVISYLTALYKKDLDGIRMFFGISLGKLMIQILYFVYQPDLHEGLIIQGYSLIKLVDICVALIFLFVMNTYIQVLKREKLTKAKMPFCIDNILKDLSPKPISAKEAEANASAIENKEAVADDGDKVKGQIYQV